LASDLRLELVLDPTLPPVTPGVVSFETGASFADVADPSNHAYEHEGLGFLPTCPGALTRLYEDLTYGVALPLVFACHPPRDADAVVAAALFLDRELVMHPAVPGLVAGVDLVHRYGPTMGGQVDEDIYRFVRLVREHVCVPLSRPELGERLRDAIGWVRDYVAGCPPHLGPPLPASRVVEVGSGGFVVAESTYPSPEAWVGLYRLGFLRGVLFGPELVGRRRVVVSRKSSHVPFDLAKAEALLNEVERLEGGDPSWRLGAPFLNGPPSGTLLPPARVVEILVRC
jgi:hypothetical protein